MDPKQLVVARGAKGLPWADFTSLGLMLGISPQLILQIYARPDRHYRSFTIPKKDGNLRKIEAPRVFLKVIQKFIADYLLQKLPVHGSVHSFRHKRSIVTNASRHTGRRWVASIDIENFFNSISIMAIYRLMKTNGFDNNSARVIAALTTFMGHLPQGSPASPPISNAILYEFDMRFDTFCARSGLVYTRYADDITISGSNIHSINLAVSEAKQDLLTNFGLSLKSDKQRIISNCSQQRVTGVVVNEKAMPSRKFRREIRAALNNAINSSEISEKDFKRLSGYISYFKSFPQFISTAEFRRLESSLLLMSKQRLE
jgi:retron-type reverse transcriptase